jgi:hypothetical protein
VVVSNTAAAAAAVVELALLATLARGMLAVVA